MNGTVYSTIRVKDVSSVPIRREHLYTFYWSLYEEIVKRGLDPLAVKLSAEGVPLPALPKQEVIRAAKLGIVYPPKTTRHILEFKLQPVKMLTSDGDA